MSFNDKTFNFLLKFESIWLIYSTFLKRFKGCKIGNIYSFSMFALINMMTIWLSGLELIFNQTNTMFRWYSKMLVRKPLTTRMATCGFLFGLGDFVCQGIEQQDKGGFTIDKIRLARFSFFGCFLAAPVLNYQCGRILPMISSKVTPSAILAKLSYDQMIFSPIYTPYIFMALALLEGKRIEDGVDSVKNKTWPTLIASWKIWPLVQLINFSLIPVKYNLLVINLVQVWWNVYLSSICNSSPQIGAQNIQLQALNY